jgi:hypothetical protein
MNVIFIGKLEKVTDQDLFINYISEHYDELKCKYRTFCGLNGYNWDEDIYSDTILKCYDAIAKKGKLNDTTSQGIENYMFISFKLNIKREGQYARVQKRDLNITSDNINDVYEEWYNSNHTTSRAKLLSDLWTDFSTLYIMNVVEQNFSQEDFYLFKLKTLCNYTYKQVQDKTNEKRVRQRIVDIKNWLRLNVKKDDVKEAFNDIYGDII